MATVSAKSQLLAALSAQISELSPHAALARQASGALLIDVRDASETALGLPTGALTAPRSFLELTIEQLAPEPSQELLLICGSGQRSLLAASNLRALGYQNLASVAGGFTRWKAEGLPWLVPFALDAVARQRYARQISLPEVGEAGQLKLARAKVLLIGAGGLGSPAALYLAAAGVGTLGICDDDRVDLSNLQRQVLHRTDRIGVAKTQSAAATLEALNPTVQVQIHPRVGAQNVDQLLASYDLVLDGSDNFPTRFLLADACVRHAKPLIYGAVLRFEGQVSVFHPTAPGGPFPCYRCLFADAPGADATPNCAEAGVLGVVPGVIGLLQASETLKLILGIGIPLLGRLLLFDARHASFREVRIPADPQCRVCHTR